jgi:hypothetical protein
VKKAVSGGHCIAHGGQGRKPCTIKGCKTTAIRGGLCSKHGEVVGAKTKIAISALYAAGCGLLEEEAMSTTTTPATTATTAAPPRPIRTKRL